METPESKSSRASRLNFERLVNLGSYRELNFEIIQLICMHTNGIFDLLYFK
jgi:hypothetical protein